MMKHVRFMNNNGLNTSISAVLYFPEGFSNNEIYPAIVVSHPGGGVKEQTAGLYASRLSGSGFITIAYDASFQGASTGEPRQLENPHFRTEDVSAVIDYLTTLPYVDNCRIGAMGICAGAGYTANAAINDRRIKAMGTVSAVNIGALFRHGWEKSFLESYGLQALDMGTKAREKDMYCPDFAVVPLAPLSYEDAPNQELLEAWEYYHTGRGQFPTAPGYATARSLTQIATYDAYHKAEAYLNQPLQIIVGSRAESKWMSNDLFKRAASTKKFLYEVKGASHMALYDVPEYLDEATSVLTEFFEEHL